MVLNLKRQFSSFLEVGVIGEVGGNLQKILVNIHFMQLIHQVEVKVEI